MHIFFLSLQGTSESHISTDEEDIMEMNETPNQMIRSDLNVPLSTEMNITKFEVLLMILHFKLRHEITDVAVRDLLKLINYIFQEKKFIETEQSLQSIFKTELKPTFHFYCGNCDTYLKEYSNL